MEHILQANNLSKIFYQPQKTVILNELNISIKAGESAAIIGPSGVGKTTLLHILATLEKPSSGELYIAGQNTQKVNCAKLRNTHIGFVFQNFHLLEEYTSLENVLMPAYIGRKTVHAKSTAYQNALQLLERVEMQSRSNFLAKHLSGGEKQRIAIARALCNNPKILFADEPTGNLDEHNSKIIHQILIDCCQKLKKTLIVVTHDLALAGLCEKIYKLENKKIVLS